MLNLKIHREGDNVRVQLSNGAQDFEQLVTVQTAALLSSMLHQATQDTGFVFQIALGDLLVSTRRTK